MAPKLTLIYFPGFRARSEPTRMILAYGGIPYTFTDCEGFYGCSFPEAKASGKLAFGQLPILDIDGEHQIAQSGAQNRYVASLVKKPGFNPSAPAKVAFCDMIHETHQDLWQIMPIVNLWTGELREQKKEEFFKNTFPPKLAALVKVLGSKKYFCGDEVTYADFAMFHIMDLVRLVEPNLISQNDNLVKWMNRVENLPGVKEYLQSRPESIGIGVFSKK